MKARVILSISIVGLGLIIAAVPQNTTHPYKLTADQLLEEVKGRQQFFSPDELADKLINKDPSIQLIDVRDQDEFEKFSLPGAINIPLSDLLNEQYTDVLNQDVKMNILYSNGSIEANEAWMITRQLGYNNLFVLEGGLNYWVETIMNPQKPASTAPNEELARYDFRQAAGSALGGGGAVQLAAPADQGAGAKPGLTKKPGKKKASGGC
ncbi:MAG: rhodanese-like domain-containing protein [Bacteroidales bacterium]